MKRNVFWVVGHLLAIVFVLVSLATGLRFALLTKSELIWLSAILPQGLLHQWHFVAGLILTSLLLAYFISRTLFASTRTFSKKHRSDRLVKTPRQKKLSPRYHKVIHRYGDLVFVVAIFSGWLTYFDLQWFLPSNLHWYSALALCLYILLHAAAYFIEFGNHAFRRILKPRTTVITWRSSIVVLVCCGSVMSLWWFWLKQPSTVLSMSPISLTTVIKIDGHANEDVWQTSNQVEVLTHGGANFNNGETVVTIKALQNGVDAFFHFRWRDETRSLKHLPLVKSADGWQVQQDGFYQFDEQTFYEDKFAVMLSKQCNHAAGTAHLGPKPLSDKPANWHGKGYHYSRDESIHDLWHWKAVRTNTKQQADDNYIGPAMEAYAGERRYTAGYHKDAKESGGYVMNWAWYKPDYVVPKRLPIEPERLAPYRLDAKKASNDIDWMATWFDYQPYTKQLDNYPVGTYMPSVLYRSNQFEGDRGNVRAVGVWSDNYWSLEVARRLDTGSEKDIAIEDGVCLWVAAFDHSQIGHTRHHQALRLKVVTP